MKSEIVTHGVWSYGTVPAHAWIVRETDDFYREEWDEDPPTLGPDGCAYYVFSGTGRELQAASRSRTFKTLQDALAYADEVLIDLTWDAAPGRARDD